MNSNLPLKSWTALNPNAREFVPTALKSITANDGPGNETETVEVPDDVKAASEKVESSDICASDEESRKYWNAQLPDDILSLDTDFLTQGGEASESVAFEPRDSSLGMSNLSAIRSDVSPGVQQWGGTFLGGRTPIDTPMHSSEYGYSRSSASAARQLWDNDQTLSSFEVPMSWNEQLFNREKRDSTNIASMRQNQHGSKNALSVLANEFPNLPSQNLIDIYQATGDVNLASGMLSQLKLQEDGSSWQSMPSASNFNSNQRLMNLSASRSNFGGGLSPNYIEEIKQHPAEFARLMRKNKMPWTHERSGAGAGAESYFRPSNLPPLSPHSDLFGGDFVTVEQEMLNFPNIRQNYQGSPQSLMENDDAVVNMLTELRDEARDHACIRNAYFEQARKGYFVGDKILAREASAKGQLHNRLMKVAQSKAAELVFQQRNISAQGPSIGPGQTQLLDLRGLHVNEAVTLLKRELSGLRAMARSSRQRQQVFISVGTGHTKGSRTPSRLLTAIKRHLVENELLTITEPQPGIVRVVVS